MKMNGVERVVKALRREEPDMVPHFELAVDPKVRNAILPGAIFGGIHRSYGLGCGYRLRQIICLEL